MFAKRKAAQQDAGEGELEAGPSTAAPSTEPVVSAEEAKKKRQAMTTEQRIGLQ